MDIEEYNEIYAFKIFGFEIFRHVKVGFKKSRYDVEENPEIVVNITQDYYDREFKVDDN